MNEYELDKIVGAMEQLTEAINLFHRKFEIKIDELLKECRYYKGNK